MIVVGFGLGKCSGRVALKYLKRPARLCGGLGPERGMPPDIVAVVTPQGRLAAGIGQAVEYLFVEAFIRCPAAHVYMRERGAGFRLNFR